MCACVTVWLNDLHRGADEACTFKKRTARVSERGKGRAEPGERGEINRRPLPSLFCDDVWSAGGPLCMGGRRWRAGERERMLNSLLTRLIDSVASLYASLSSPHTQFFFFFSLCSLPLIVCAERHLESSSNRFPTCCRDTLVTHSNGLFAFFSPCYRLFTARPFSQRPSCTDPLRFLSQPAYIKIQPRCHSPQLLSCCV